MMIKKRGIAFKLSFYILISCTIIFMSLFFYNYLISRDIIINNIEETGEKLTRVSINKIEMVLRPIEKVPKNIAYSIENVNFNKDEVICLLKSIVHNNPEIFGATIAFEPYSFDKDTKFFAPYYFKQNGKLKLKYLGDDYYYNYFYKDWYQIPKMLSRPCWSEPYFDTGGGNIIMSTYSVPFYKKSSGGIRKFIGIVTADISLTWLQKIVSSIKLGETGYGVLISKNGTFITHPINNLVMNETIFSLAEEHNDINTWDIGKKMVNGNSGVVIVKNIVNNKKSWMVYEPLKSSGWSVGLIFPQEETVRDLTNLNKTVFLLGIIGFLFLLTIIISISRNITRPLRILAASTKDIAKGDLDFEIPPATSDDEVGKLSVQFINMRDALKKYIKEITETTASKKRIESELQIAQSIQLSIVPKNFPPFAHKKEFDIFAKLLPSMEVGGDFYDFFFIDDNHLCFVIADVSGKGVPSALLMATTKTLIKIVAAENRNPADILRRVNRGFLSENEACMFVRIFCAVLDTITGEVNYVNAGIEPPFIVKQDGLIKMLSDISYAPLGLYEETEYFHESFLLEANDIIFMYTDGVTEASNKNSEMFGAKRLIKAIAKYKNEPVKDLVLNVIKEIIEFSDGFEQYDDITVQAIKFFQDGKKNMETQSNKTSLSLKNQVNEIERLTEFIDSYGKNNMLDSKTIYDLRLALEEIIVNIVSYAYKDKEEHEIKVVISIVENIMTIEVIDDGKEFNPLEVPDPDINKPLEERDIGGLGIFFVRHFTDSLAYSRNGDFNILTMKKNLKP